MPVYRFPYAVSEAPLDVLEAAVARVEKSTTETVIDWKDYANEIVVVTAPTSPAAATTAARRQTRAKGASR